MYYGEPRYTGPSKQTNLKSKWKRLLGKKWLFPAVYVGLCTCLLATVFFYQSHNTGSDTAQVEEQTVSNLSTDAMNYPCMASSGAELKMGFFNEKGSAKDKESALVKYDDAIWVHSGVDFARKDGKTFEVVAALDGKVFRLQDNPLVGKQIVLEHANGTFTTYQSIDNLKVKMGEVVSKGDVLAEAGRNNFEKDAGVHLHFEVKQNNQRKNPTDLMKSLN